MMISQEDRERDERVVRDGERINVPLLLMDGLQREVAERLVEEDQRIAAYDEYVHYITNAWRGPVVRPPAPKATFVRTGDASRDAYLEYKAALQDAWRNP